MMTSGSIRPGSFPANDTGAPATGRYRDPHPYTSAKNVRDWQNYLIIRSDILFESNLSRDYLENVNLLSEKDVFLLQHLREHKRLLIVHVVVQCTVNQVVHLILDILDFVEQLALLVALQIIGNGRQTHKSLGVN